MPATVLIGWPERTSRVSFLKKLKKQKMKTMTLHQGFFFPLSEGGDYVDWLHVRQKPGAGINRTARLCDGGYKVADKRGEPHTEWL